MHCSSRVYGAHALYTRTDCTCLATHSPLANFQFGLTSQPISMTLPYLRLLMYAEGLLLRATHFPLVPGGGVPSFELDEQD